MTRLNGCRLSSLATLGVAALGWLCFVCWPVRDPDLKRAAFDDVMAGMPGFADYALVVASGALLLAFSNTAYAVVYWPRRVRINRSGQYMTWADQRDVNLAASPFFAASIALCSRPLSVAHGRAGGGLLTMWRLNHPDDMAPPVTGDPYPLTPPGWSRRQTLAVWTDYLLAYCGSRFLAYVVVGLLAYPVAWSSSGCGLSSLPRRLHRRGAFPATGGFAPEGRGLDAASVGLAVDGVRPPTLWRGFFRRGGGRHGVGDGERDG